MEKINVKSDALGVIDRIKKWNNNYEIYFNLKNKKYMLYLKESDLNPHRYCLTFPYDTIDERMFDYTLKSEIQNRDNYLKEIEESNARLLKAEQNKIIKQMENTCENKTNY